MGVLSHLHMGHNAHAVGENRPEVEKLMIIKN